MTSREIFAKELNSSQAEAAQTLDGPLLILAGAGSGKTRVLTYRIANLIMEGKAAPTEILAMTFTNKAARSMESRSVDLLKRFGVPVWDRLWISTFHATCVRILREHIDRIGYQPFFGIYDQSDQLSVIKRVVDNLGLNEKIYPPKTFQSLINDFKMKAITPEKLAKKSLNFLEEKGLDVYRAYEIEMRKANALDFGDLLLKTLGLFEETPDVLAKYRDKFKYIMVDEYQDTNHIQYLIIKALASGHQNLCVVGDEDQSIYGWRGADIRNILDFEKDFANAKVVKLEENYRSSKTIVEAASHVIKNNLQRKNKTLFTSNPPGEKITVREEASEYDEARFVARKISELLPQATHGLKDFAIFYRTNAQSRVLEEALRTSNIGYKIVGGVKFYERMEIKDLLSYLRLLINPNDDVALTRIINTPVRGIGKTTIEKIQQFAAPKGLSFYQAIPEALSASLFNSSTGKKLHAFLEILENLRTRTQSLSPSQAYHILLDETGYVSHLKQQDTSEAEARIDNLEELDNALVQFEKERGEEASLQGFLEEIALVSDIDKMSDDDNSVTLMTLHVSKGLEYPFVFIVGMEDNIFPSGRSFADNDPNELEEERRLAYVGMTRAEQLLFLTYARNRKVWGVDQHNPPSRFLGEIPQQYADSSSALSQAGFMRKFQDRFGDNAGGVGSPRVISGNSAGTPSYAGSFGVKDQPNWQADDNSQTFPNDDGEGGNGYIRGMKVKHPTFGVGTIFKIEGAGDEQKISILFQNNTLKKFVSKYARLEVM